MAVESSHPLADYTNKTDEQKKILTEFLDALAVAEEYCQPYFNKFIRFDRLFRGALPPELDGTYSKLMFQIPFSMIQNEIPRATRALLSTTQWFGCTALEPEFEDQSEMVQKYLRYQMETVQRIAATIIPTLQQTHVFGTGYRMYGHQVIHKKLKQRVPTESVMGIPVGFHDEVITKIKTVISGNYLGIYDVWPLPGGGLINAFDDQNFSCCDGVIVFDYMNAAQIQSEVDKGVFDKQQAEYLMTRKAGNDDRSDQYKAQVATASNNASYQTMPNWMQTMRNKEGMPKRWRINWYFRRDKWTIIGEDCAVLYDGEPFMDCIPIAKFMSAFDMNEFFGKGLIEITEDVILSTLLLLCHRFDYLAGTMHPPTWIKESILEHLGGDRSLLDPGPYQVLPFPNNIGDIRQAVMRDRFQDISQQAFIEDEKLSVWLQKISGQPNYGQGLANTPGAPMNETATGIMGLISEGTAAAMMRACTTEETGLADCLYLTLKLASQFYQEDQKVRLSTGADGWPWETINWEELNDGYQITVHGSREFSTMEQSFRRMIEAGNSAMGVVGAFGPQVLEDPKEFVRQIMVASNSFKNIDKIVGASSPSMLPPGLPPGPVLPESGQGGGLPSMPGQGSLGNEMRSVGAVRNQPPVMAGNIPV